MIRVAVLINRTRMPAGRAPWLAGLSLAKRVVLAAQRAGIEEVLVVGGANPASWLAHDARVRLRWRWIPLARHETAWPTGSPAVGRLESGSEVAALQVLHTKLSEPFFLLFADSVVEATALRVLREVSLNGPLLLRAEPQAPANAECPAASVFVVRPELLARLESVGGEIETFEQLWAHPAWRHLTGTLRPQGRTWERTTKRKRLATIERELNQFHLKPTDGIFAKFNKTVVAQPLIRFFLRTPATPNFITGLGLIFALLAGGVFALGGYWWAILGAVLAYLSAIMDHVDGMVARLKFQESDFGVWFESAVDYTSYLAIFTGMAIGFYRETRFAYYLFMGGLFIFGTVLSFFLQSRQRHRISADNPADYAQRIHRKMEEQRSNFFCWFGRNVYFLVRRAVLPYFILLFCLLNVREFLLGFVTFGANLFWLLCLYNNHLFARFPTFRGSDSD